MDVDPLELALEEEKRLAAKLQDVRAQINAIRIYRTGIAVGDLVQSSRYGVCRVTHIEPSTWRKPWLRGNPKIKDGSFGKLERNLYTDWEKLV